MPFFSLVSRPKSHLVPHSRHNGVLKCHIDARARQLGPGERTGRAAARHV
jgi:hypothetical protein